MGNVWNKEEKKKTRKGGAKQRMEAGKNKERKKREGKERTNGGRKLKKERRLEAEAMACALRIAQPQCHVDNEASEGGNISARGRDHEV